MKENETSVLVNAITGLYLIQTVDGDRFRVSVRDSFKNYVADSNGNRVLRSTNSFLLHPSVLFAYIHQMLPYVGVALSKVKAAFAKDPTSPAVAAYVQRDDAGEAVVDDNGKLVLDYNRILNSLLRDTIITMQLEFHAAGELQLLDDGQEIQHTMDKFSIDIIDAKYSPAIAARAEAYEAAEAAKLAKDTADLTNALDALGI